MTQMLGWVQLLPAMPKIVTVASTIFLPDYTNRDISKEDDCLGKKRPNKQKVRSVRRQLSCRLATSA